MNRPAPALLAATVLVALAACSAHGAQGSTPHSVTVCGFLKSGGLEAGVNMPGDITPGESVTLEAYNPGPPVRLAVTTFTIGGDEGLSGNTAGPDTIHVGKVLTIPRSPTGDTGNFVNLGTFPVKDQGAEYVPGPQLLQTVNGVDIATGC